MENPKHRRNSKPTKYIPVNRNLTNSLPAPKTPLLKGVGSPFSDPGGFVQAVRIRRKPYEITVLRRAESLRVAFSRRPTSAQGISSTNQIENLGSHLPLTREALGAFDSSINICLHSNAYLGIEKRRCEFRISVCYCMKNYSLAVLTLTPGPMVEATTQERIY